MPLRIQFKLADVAKIPEKLATGATSIPDLLGAAVNKNIKFTFDPKKPLGGLSNIFKSNRAPGEYVTNNPVVETLYSSTEVNPPLVSPWQKYLQDPAFMLTAGVGAIILLLLLVRR